MYAMRKFEKKVRIAASFPQQTRLTVQLLLFSYCCSNHELSFKETGYKLNLVTCGTPCIKTWLYYGFLVGCHTTFHDLTLHDPIGIWYTSTSDEREIISNIQDIRTIQGEIIGSEIVTELIQVSSIINTRWLDPSLIARNRLPAYTVLVILAFK